MGDRDGGGSRGRMEDANSVSDFAWNPADHATYCPQHNEPPPDGGGSSWLCCCSGPLFELRAAARAVIDAEYGSNTWAEAFDVLVDVVAEQERLEALAERGALIGSPGRSAAVPSESSDASGTPRSASALLGAEKGTA